MTIKHIVLSGGGPVLIQYLSAIQELEQHNFLHMSDIESIYGTSAGAIVAVMISLKFEWETLNDYIIKRPWQDVFPIKVQNILDAYSKKGIFDISHIEKCFKPLFEAKNLSLYITLKEYYELTKIDIHMYSFEINDYIIHDISHKTHPDVTVLNAIHMSCAMPVLISPVFIDNGCFIDGGVACNYPLNFCLESGKKPEEIIGFKNKYSIEKTDITTDSTLLDYILNFLFKAIFNVHNNYIQQTIKNEILCNADYLSLHIIKNTLSSIEIRKTLFEKGICDANAFLLGETK